MMEAIKIDTIKFSAQILAAEYAPNTSRILTAMKKLDKRAKRPARVLSYFLGAMFLLLFAFGVLTLAEFLILQSWGHLILGMATLSGGILGLALNVEIFQIIVQKTKHQYAFEIVELAKKICQEEIESI